MLCRGQDVETVCPEECTRSFHYMKDIWKSGAKNYPYEGQDFVKVLPDWPHELSHISPTIYRKFVEMGGPTKPLFEQRLMNVAIDKITMRKRSVSDECGSKPKRGRPASEPKKKEG